MLAWPHIRKQSTDHSYEDADAFQQQARAFLDGVLVVPLQDEGIPSESSHAVARIIKQEGIVAAGNMVFPRDLLTRLKGIHTVAVVDDHVGSGTQIEDFWTKPQRFDGARDRIALRKLAAALPKLSFSFIVFAGVKESLARLRAGYADIEIVCPEVIDDRHRVFSGDSQIWRDQEERDHAKSALERVCGPAGVPLVGFNDFDYAYATQLGTPDWTIPMLRWRRNGWTPLLS